MVLAKRRGCPHKRAVNTPANHSMRHLWSTEVGQFRVVSLLEGLSYLLLLGIAVPVKYLAHDPSLVRLMGRVHGALFVLFVLALVRAATAASWSARQWGTAAIASVVPGGAFWLERKLRSEEPA